MVDHEDLPGVAPVQSLQVWQRNEMHELGVPWDALRGVRPDDGAIPALQARVPEDVQRSLALLIRDGALQAQCGSPADDLHIVLYPASLDKESQ